MGKDTKTTAVGKAWRRERIGKGIGLRSRERHRGSLTFDITETNHERLKARETVRNPKQPLTRSRYRRTRSRNGHR